ncbi:MAG: carbohydrate ABC transporter permease [Anaerolineae bacterium]|nr:carbohydrate ABC transporter permease [Anaerolineae bacterium]
MSDSWDRGILTTLELRTAMGRGVYILFLVILVLLAITVLFPFLFAFSSGLKSSTEIYKGGLAIFPAVPQWENYTQAMLKFNILEQFKNSFIIVIGGLIFQLTVSTLAAYSLARLKPFGGRYILWGFLVTLMIPSISYIIPLYTTLVKLPILNISLLNNFLGLWLPYAVNAVAIFLMKTFFESIPSDLFDAAKVDGASALRTFWSIALPLSRPILIVLVIVGFLALWKDFLLPLLVLPDPKLQPITVRLFYMLNVKSAPSPLNIQMAASFLALLPPLLIAIVLQGYLKRGISAGAVRG